MNSIPFRARGILLLSLTPLFIALIIYSVTWSFVWDEGFHLIAAQLIASGKRPYIDFCFPQTPLNAYVNAGILLVFGSQWRPVHLASAIYICIAVWMVADFVQSRLPDEKWRTPCALVAAVLFGLNSVVFEFGSAGQAYGIAMLLGTAAFRAALPAVVSRRPGFALLAGLFAGSAAASTLLTAPVPAVLFVWIVFCTPKGRRVWKAIVYLIGCVIPFLPVIWLYLLGPKQTVFNVLQYQALFRRINWGDANLQDVNALTSWLNSPEALIFISLSATALIYIFRAGTPAWEVARREFLLAAAMSAALVVFISTAHPTFDRYFCVAVPYLGIVAALGFYALASRLDHRAWLSGGLVIALSSCMFLRDVFDERDEEHWSDYEQLAQSVAEVTPLGATLFADEVVYFLLQRDPPEGMEFSYAERLELPHEQERLFHIISMKELKQEMQAGHFATLQTCKQSLLDDFAPGKYFRQHTEPNDCDVFWEPKASAAKR